MRSVASLTVVGADGVGTGADGFELEAEALPTRTGTFVLRGTKPFERGRVGVLTVTVGLLPGPLKKKYQYAAPAATRQIKIIVKVVRIFFIILFLLDSQVFFGQL